MQSRKEAVNLYHKLNKNIKSNNLTRKAIKKSLIILYIAILKNEQFDRSKSILHIGCTNIIFADCRVGVEKRGFDVVVAKIFLVCKHNFYTPSQIEIWAQLQLEN